MLGSMLFLRILLSSALIWCVFSFLCPSSFHVFEPRQGTRVDLARTLALDDQAFRDTYRGSPIKRARRSGLARNAALAVGNQPDPAARSALEAAVNSDPDPMVQDAAHWALARLPPPARQP